MIDFSKVRRVTIPEGKVVKITDEDGNVIWDRSLFDFNPSKYVSFGDSIAAGHLINSTWKEGSQYGNNGREDTAIYENTYTALISAHLSADGTPCEPTSFAVSGYQVKHVIAQLQIDSIAKAVLAAELVTICIGANDIFTTVLENIEDYLFGQIPLKTITDSIEKNLTALNNDNYAYSYTKLFEALHDINSNAKYIFTTIYNPYKELYLNVTEDGFLNGFLDAIPETIHIDIGKKIKDKLGIKLPFDIIIDPTAFLRTAINDSPWVQDFYTRINAIRILAEQYLSNFNEIAVNQTLRRKIEEFNQAEGAEVFKLVDTKALYDAYAVAKPGHYSDLVNSKYGYDTDIFEIHWGRLWEGSTKEAFWHGLFEKYIHINWEIFDRPIWEWPNVDHLDEYYTFNPGGAWDEAVDLITEKIFEPDLDPHPTEEGHKILYDSFMTALAEQ